jgi:hypothetical protein
MRSSRKYGRRLARGKIQSPAHLRDHAISQEPLGPEPLDGELPRKDDEARAKVLDQLTAEAQEQNGDILLFARSPALPRTARSS